MYPSLRFVMVAAVGLSAAAVAEDREGKPGGPYAGVEAGAVDHHFVVEETIAGLPPTSRNVTEWGAGGGVFAGYNIDAAPRIRIGAEASFNFGGRTPATESALGQRLSLKPRYGYSLTARAGYVVRDDFVVYGGGGYGGHRYRVTAPPGASDITDWNNSFILLGGVEIRVSPRARIRLEFMHLDGTRNQIMAGIPIRF